MERSQRYPVHPQAMLVTKGKETQIAPIDRQFGSKTVGQRALSIFAGPLMNFILGVCVVCCHISNGGVPLDNATYVQIGEVLRRYACRRSRI